MAAVPDTEQLTTTTPPSEPPPPFDARRRGVLVALSLAAVAALIAGGISIVRGPDPDGNAAMNKTQHPQSKSTLDPSSTAVDEAGAKFAWPLVAGDDFNGGQLDLSHWGPYSGKTTDNVGQHEPKNLSVADGLLTITSHGKSSGGLAWNPGQKYGRWEVRAKTQVGTGYGAVMLLWPDAEDWPKGGEIDFMEIPKPERNEAHFIVHYGKSNNQNGTSTSGDFTQWHNYAVEWAPDHVAGFIDGQEIFRTTDGEAGPAARDAPGDPAGRRPVRRRLDPRSRCVHPTRGEAPGRLGAHLQHVKDPETRIGVLAAWPGPRYRFPN